MGSMERNEKTRTNTGTAVSAVGIALNFCLAAAKFCSAYLRDWFLSWRMGQTI